MCCWACRDLKSGNLLVDQDNVVRVADFGLSRLYHGMHTMTGGLGTFQVSAGCRLVEQTLIYTGTHAHATFCLPHCLCIDVVFVPVWLRWPELHA